MADVYVNGQLVTPCVKKKGDVEFKKSISQQVEEAPKLNEGQ